MTTSEVEDLDGKPSVEFRSKNYFTTIGKVDPRFRRNEVYLLDEETSIPDEKCNFCNSAAETHFLQCCGKRVCVTCHTLAEQCHDMLERRKGRFDTGVTTDDLHNQNDFTNVTIQKTNTKMSDANIFEAKQSGTIVFNQNSNATNVLTRSSPHQFINAKQPMRCYFCNASPIFDLDENSKKRKKLLEDRVPEENGENDEMSKERNKARGLPFSLNVHSLEDSIRLNYLRDSELECRVCGSYVEPSKRKQHIKKTHLCTGFNTEGEREKVDCFFKSCGCTWRGFPGAGEDKHITYDCVYAKLILSGLFSPKELKSLDIMQADSPLLDLTWSRMDRIIFFEVVKFQRSLQKFSNTKVNPDSLGNTTFVSLFDEEEAFLVPNFNYVWNSLVFNSDKLSLLDSVDDSPEASRESENPPGKKRISDDNDKLDTSQVKDMVGAILDLEASSRFMPDNTKSMRDVEDCKRYINEAIRELLLKRTLPDLVWLVRHGNAKLRCLVGPTILRLLQTSFTRAKEGRRVLTECKIHDAFAHFMKTVPYRVHKNRFYELQMKFRIGETLMWTEFYVCLDKILDNTEDIQQRTQLAQVMLSVYMKNKKVLTFGLKTVIVLIAAETIYVQQKNDKLVSTFLDAFEDIVQNYVDYMHSTPEPPIEKEDSSTGEKNHHSFNRKICRVILNLAHASPGVAEKMLRQKPKILDALFDMAYLRDGFEEASTTLASLTSFEKDNGTGFLIKTFTERFQTGKKCKNVGWFVFGQKRRSEEGAKSDSSINFLDDVQDSAPITERFLTGYKYGHQLGILEQLLDCMNRITMGWEFLCLFYFLRDVFASVSDEDIRDVPKGISKKLSARQKTAQSVRSCMAELTQLGFFAAVRRVRKNYYLYMPTETEEEGKTKGEKKDQKMNLVYVALSNCQHAFLQKMISNSESFVLASTELESILNEGLLVFAATWMALVPVFNPALRPELEYMALSIVEEGDRKSHTFSAKVEYLPKQLTDMLFQAMEIINICARFYTKEVSKSLASRTLVSRSNGRPGDVWELANNLKDSPMFVLAVLYDALLEVLPEAIKQGKLLFDMATVSAFREWSYLYKMTSLARSSLSIHNVQPSKVGKSTLLKIRAHSTEEIDEINTNIDTDNDTRSNRSTMHRVCPNLASKCLAQRVKKYIRSNNDMLTIAPDSLPVNLDSGKHSKSSTENITNSSTHESGCGNSFREPNSGVSIQDERENYIEESDKNTLAAEEDDIQIIPIFKPWVDETGLFEWEAGGITLTLAVSGRGQ